MMTALVQVVAAPLRIHPVGENDLALEKRRRNIKGEMMMMDHITRGGKDHVIDQAIRRKTVGGTIKMIKT